MTFLPVQSSPGTLAEAGQFGNPMPGYQGVDVSTLEAAIAAGGGLALGAVSPGMYSAWVGVHRGFTDAVEYNAGGGAPTVTVHLATPVTNWATAVVRCTPLTGGGYGASVTGVLDRDNTTITVTAETFHGAAVAANVVQAPVKCAPGFIIEVLQF